MIHFSQSLIKRCYSTTTTNNAFMMKNKIYDITIIGAGIVGTATAREIKLQSPNLNILVLEKEKEAAMHQSSHNSGVIHCGIYYKPHSLKARLCREGSEMMINYCSSNNIAYEQGGKLIVATNQRELESLESLYKRGIENKVKGLKLLNNRDDISKYEPYIDGGIGAIHCPTTAIVNYKDVVRHFVKDTEELGNAEFKYNFKVSEIIFNEKDKLLNIISSTCENELIQSKYIISCAGMYSDRISKMVKSINSTTSSTNNNNYNNNHNNNISKDQYQTEEEEEEEDMSIIPFRGSFLKFKKEYSHLIKSNVYPVPNPEFPFLGIHFTKRMDTGDIWLGPNAVLAFHREGYSYKDISIRDLFEIITNRGLLKLSRKHWRYGANELCKDIFKKKFLENLKPYMTTITEDMIDFDSHQSGVRSQAISNKTGQLIEDFVFDALPNKFPILHVKNSPSPSATSSLMIAKEILLKFNLYFPNVLSPGTKYGTSNLNK